MRQSIHIDFIEFDNNYDLERLKRYMEYAERHIHNLEETIERVREYQKQLGQHMQKVEQTEMEKVVTITRRTEYVGWNKTKVFYYVRLEYRPKISDFDKFQTVYKYAFVEKFPGTERHKARKYAEQLAQEHDCRIEGKMFMNRTAKAVG